MTLEMMTKERDDYIVRLSKLYDAIRALREVIEALGRLHNIESINSIKDEIKHLRFLTESTERVLGQTQYRIMDKQASLDEA